MRAECDDQLKAQREYYDKRYSEAIRKKDEAVAECDSLKLQIRHLKAQSDKTQEDIDLRDEHYERISGQYDSLERQYQILKKEYKALEKTKTVDASTHSASSDDHKEDGGGTSGTTKRKQKRRNKAQGPLPWLEDESDDDEVTVAEKKSIRKWLSQRHGEMDNSPNHNAHWLILPEDRLAGKDQDIEDLNATIKALKQDLDAKGRDIGRYKQQIQGVTLCRVQEREEKE